MILKEATRGGGDPMVVGEGAATWQGVRAQVGDPPNTGESQDHPYLQICVTSRIASGEG